MKFTPLILLALLLTACGRDNHINDCNYLLNAGVNATVNLNLPEYSELQYTSRSVYIANQGNGGIIVTNTGTGLRAWDAADPNHAPNLGCITMTIKGTEAHCNCGDENKYTLFTGQLLQGALPCGLKEYRVTPMGNNTYSITN